MNTMVGTALPEDLTPRQDGAEIGVESARTAGNVEIGAVACLGLSISNPDVATHGRSLHCCD